MMSMKKLPSFFYPLLGIIMLAFFATPSLQAQGTLTLTDNLGYVRKVTLTILAEGEVSIQGATGTFINGEPVIYTLTDKSMIISGDLRAVECKKNSLSGIELKGLANLNKLVIEDNQFTRLDLSECPKIDSLFAYRNKISELVLPSPNNLLMLNVGNNQLTTLDVSSLTQLKGLFCYYNKLTELNLPSGDALEAIACNNNKISQLDVKGRKNLRSLTCHTNQIASLDLSDCTELSNLICNSNKMKTLTLKNTPKLKTLQCHINELTELPLEGLSGLQALYCYTNKLTALDLKHTPLLEQLSYWENNIAQMDFSLTPNLKELWCAKNGMESINVSMLPQLITLSVADNQIKTLDLSKNPLLESLFVSFNLLEELDLSKNPKVVDLECEGNKLKGAGMTRFIQSLPTLNTEKNIILITMDKEDGNVANTRQIAFLKAKKWSPRRIDRDLPKPYLGIAPKENTHILLIANSIENGTVELQDHSIDITEIPASSEVELLITPKEGYELTSLTWMPIDEAGTPTGEKTDILPAKKVAVTQNMLIDAAFQEVKSLAEVASVEVSIYPNPTSKVLFIESIPQEEVKLFTMNGVRLLSTTTNEEGKAVLETSGLSSGKYIVTVNGKSQVVLINQ